MNEMLNANTLMPSAGELQLPGGLPSLFGSALSMDKANMAKQFIQAQLDELPYRTEANIGQLKNQIAQQPMEHNVKMAKLGQEYADLEGQPEREFIDEAGELWNQIKGKDPISQARSYAQALEKWKRKYPGKQLPQELTNFSPETTMPLLEEAYNMRRYGIKFSQEKQLKDEHNATEIRKAEIAAAARLQAARLSRANQEKKVNPAQRRVELIRIIRDPNTSKDAKEVAKAELEDLVAPTIEEEIRKKFGDESTALFLGGSRPEYMNQRKAAIEAERALRRKAYGLDQDTTVNKKPVPKGKVRVKKDGQTYLLPENQLDQALKQGYTKDE